MAVPLAGSSKCTIRSGTKNDCADVRILPMVEIRLDGLSESRIAVNMLERVSGCEIERRGGEKIE